MGKCARTLQSYMYMYIFSMGSVKIKEHAKSIATGFFCMYTDFEAIGTLLQKDV